VGKKTPRHDDAGGLAHLVPAGCFMRGIWAQAQDVKNALESGLDLLDVT
jgi:hypothetical protein